jgi:hypothetical protein
MANGELPHLDFMTPIGILGFAPVAGFLALGFPVGKATLLAGAALLALMLPVIWWVAATRLSRGQAYYYGAIMVITMMAVVFGGGASTISLSMYYNRWGWSIAFLVLTTVLFPPRRMLGEGWVAPLVIGLGMAALAMLKMTFFVPLLPVVTLLLLVQKQGGQLLKAAIIGGLVGLALLGWLGLDYFLAYIHDLLVVMQPLSSRVNAGVSFANVVASPRSIITSIILFVALLLFRKTGRMNEGLAVLLLAPAFAYIIYQNWGNDPKWLHLMVLYIWANLPEAGAKPVFAIPARQVGLALIVASFTFIFPSTFAMSTTPIRVALAENASGAAKLELRDGISDIWLPEGQVQRIIVEQALAGMPTLSPELEPVEINGFTFPDCQQRSLLVAQYQGMAKQIEAVSAARGRPVLVADVLNALWLMADFERVAGAAPWYYGDSAGLANAEFLAVPFCPVKPILRAGMVQHALEGGYVLREVRRTNLMVLYAVAKQAE